MTATVERPVAHPISRFVLQLLLVLGVSFVLGGSTSFAQTILPDALRPFANSASGWTLLTALAVGMCRARTLPSAALGAISFVALVLGYETVSNLRGFPTDETLFLLIGLVIGPFVGTAATWLRRTGWRTAVGCGLLAGVALGESVYGLVVVSSTTGWFYWTLIGVAALGLLVHVLMKQLDNTRDRLITAGLVLLVATTFFLSYNALGQLVF